jgi:multidrug efflux pump subunit AcrB
MVRNPVAANLLMAVLVIGGLMTMATVRQEEFPAIETDMIQVSVSYLGATPEEAEQGVCIRVEEELQGLQDVDRMTSIAVEGACVVSVEFLPGTDPNSALDEVESRVNAISTFPVETEKPVVRKFLLRSPVVQVAVTGELDERSLKIVSQEVRDEIAALPGVSQVELEYVKPYEIAIEVSEATLRRHELTFDEVATAIRRWSLDVPGGSVKASGGEILLRTKGQAYDEREFEEIVVLTRTDGTTVTVGEIATVIDGFQDGDLSARFDGMPAGIVTVMRMGDEDILEIEEAAREYLRGKRHEVPAGVRLVEFNNEADSLRARLGALLGSARSGLVLVAITLALFLRFRLAMWVTAGVPIALIGAFTLFPAWDLTISSLAVLAFILVLGIVVDDAIVVGESVYSHERRGVDQVTAAIEGTRDVYVPVVFGVLTTVAAFLPLILIPGHMGSFFGYIGYTAILCLGFSLLESQWILPAHLAHRRTDSKSGHANPVVAMWQRLQGTLGEGLERFGRESYGRALGIAMEWRYVTLAAAVGFLVITIALFASGRLRYQFFPAVEGDTVYATLTMPRGIPVEVTEEAISKLEASAEALRAELDAERSEEQGSAILQVLTTIGKQQQRDGPPVSQSIGGSHLGEVSINLVGAEDRSLGSYEIAGRWRELTGSIPDAVEIAFAALAFSAGRAIHVELRGGSVEELTGAAQELKHAFSSYSGVYDLADSYRAGKQEVSLSVRPEARSLGITQDDLGRQVRQAFYGEEVQRIQRERDDVRVMLRYTDAERRTLASLEDMRIRAVDGTEVPFGALADIEIGRGFSTIRRTDRMRVVNVTGEIDRDVATPESVLAGVEADMPTILADYPNITYSFGGEQREHGKAVTGIIRGTALAMLLIYALLAIPLGSYSQPLVIMSVIPFGTVGAMIGHWIMGFDVVFFSVLGMIALSGVVVNGSLVLVHFVNRRRAEGASIVQAVTDAGITRFRPIVLTSVTTFLGLVPLMFENNPQAGPMIPMAVSLAYGVLFAAVVTLFLVPSLYLVLEDVRGLRAKVRARASTPAPSAVAGGH